MRRKRSYRYRARRRPGTYRRTYRKGLTRRAGLSAYRFRQRGLRPELKYFDISSSDAFISASTIKAICTVGQGTAANQRVGRKIRVKSVAVQAWLEAVESSANTPENKLLTVDLILDKQPNGALASVTNVFVGQDIMDFPLIEYSQRFKILKRKYIRGPQPSFVWDTAAGATSNAGYNLPFVMYKKVNIPVEFGGTGATIADVVTNAFLFSVRQVNGSDQPAFTLHWKARCRFTDA